MSTRPNSPSPLPWSAHDLADAVPLGLFELYRFDGACGAADNAVHFVGPKVARHFRGGYARLAPLPTRFSVHH